MKYDFNDEGTRQAKPEPYWKINDTYKFRGELRDRGLGRAYVSKHDLPYEATLVREYNCNGREFIALQTPAGFAFGLSKDVADEVYTNIERLQLKPDTVSIQAGVSLP